MAKGQRDRRDRDRRRGQRRRIFLIALAALIFAEAGYILVPLGVVDRLLGRRVAPSYDDFLADVQAWRLVNGSWAPTDLGRPASAYIYVVTSDRLTQAALAKAAVDSLKAPTYLFFLDPYYAPMGPEDVIREVNSTVYPLGGRLTLLFPRNPDPRQSKALAWAIYVAEAGGYITQAVQLVPQLPPYTPYRIEVRNGTVASVIGVV